MRKLTLALAVSLAPFAAAADLAGEITDSQILPAFDRLAGASAGLAAAAAADCDPRSGALRTAYGTAFDAWVAASHLRFGPTETGNRAFALAFWPDSRGKTPKALGALIRSGDPKVADPEAFASYSIAARGFYALEYLLYDGGIQDQGSADYRCTLTRAISRDIAATTQAIRTDWHDAYADELRQPGGRYRSEDEAEQELFKALTTGLQITADMRLGRPLGTFDRPRPNRAEARLSQRSQRHVVVSLKALKPLALALAGEDSALAAELAAQFDYVIARAEALDDPDFSGVSEPGTRIRIEALQQDVHGLYERVAGSIGPALGVDIGFNALDGD